MSGVFGDLGGRGFTIHPSQGKRNAPNGALLERRKMPFLWGVQIYAPRHFRNFMARQMEAILVYHNFRVCGVPCFLGGPHPEICTHAASPFGNNTGLYGMGDTLAKLAGKPMAF